MVDATSRQRAQAAPTIAAHPAVTVSALISAFYQSYGFTKNPPISQRAREMSGARRAPPMAIAR